MMSESGLSPAKLTMFNPGICKRGHRDNLSTVNMTCAQCFFQPDQAAEPFRTRFLSSAVFVHHGLLRTTKQGTYVTCAGLSRTQHDLRKRNQRKAM